MIVRLVFLYVFLSSLSFADVQFYYTINGDTRTKILYGNSGRYLAIKQPVADPVPHVEINYVSAGGNVSFDPVGVVSNTGAFESYYFNWYLDSHAPEVESWIAYYVRPVHIIHAFGFGSIVLVLVWSVILR